MKSVIDLIIHRALSVFHETGSPPRELHITKNKYEQLKHELEAISSVLTTPHWDGIDTLEGEEYYLGMKIVILKEDGITPLQEVLH